MRKIGLFGATLDPPHTSHVTLVESAIKQFSLDLVVVVPTDKVKYKNVQASLLHRVRMAKLAFCHLKNVKVFPLDHGDSPSYLTVDKMMNLFNIDSLYFIMGADSFIDLHTWDKFDFLRKHCTFLVGNRKFLNGRTTNIPKNCSEMLLGKFVDYEVLSCSLEGYSSTEVRNSMKQRSFCETIPDAVYDYIKENNLYL